MTWLSGSVLSVACGGESCSLSVSRWRRRELGGGDRCGLGGGDRRGRRIARRYVPTSRRTCGAVGELLGDLPGDVCAGAFPMYPDPVDVDPFGLSVEWCLRFRSRSCVVVGGSVVSCLVGGRVFLVWSWLLMVLSLMV